MRAGGSPNRQETRSKGSTTIVAMGLKLDRFDDFHLYGASAPE